MKHWSFVMAALAVVVIGCGGSGGNNGGSSGSGTNTTGTNSTAVVNLPNVPGLVNFVYLTGQGRAIGSPTATISRIELTDEYGTVIDDISPPLQLQLDAYTENIRGVNVPIPDDVASRLFTTYQLLVTQVFISGGATFGDGSIPLVDEGFPANIRAFEGRHTSVQIFLDNSVMGDEGIMQGGSQNGEFLFDANQFAALNFNGDTFRIEGFLSDFVRFDISQVLSKPQLSDLRFAGAVYFSGDHYAISEGGNQGTFEMLTPFTTITGTFAPPPPLGGGFGPGTYTLLQDDPRNPDNSTSAKIAALQGVYRNLSQVVSGLGTFEAISFPNSEEGSPDDDDLDRFTQDFVMVVRNGSLITQMYFGEIDYEDGTFRMYPIDQIVSGDAANEISGTISDLKNAAGGTANHHTEVREGSFAFNDGTTLPPGFAASGRFIVFRR